MTTVGSILCSVLFFCSISIQAQRVDTVRTNDPNFPYRIVEMDAKGRPHGVERVYDNKGVLRRKYQNVNGIWQGPDTTYDEAGRVRGIALVENGSVNGEFLSYDPDGNLAATRAYRKGKPHGLSTYYYANGQVSMTMYYKNGEVHGISHLYHRNGNLEWRKGYREGKLHGERFAWDSTGVLMEGEHTFRIAPFSSLTFTVTCHKGLPEGAIQVRGPDGKLSFTGQYVNGLPDGEWIYYERTGLVDSVDVYKLGKFKETRRNYD